MIHVDDPYPVRVRKTNAAARMARFAFAAAVLLAVLLLARWGLHR